GVAAALGLLGLLVALVVLVVLVVLAPAAPGTGPRAGDFAVAARALDLAVAGAADLALADVIADRSAVGAHADLAAVRVGAARRALLGAAELAALLVGALAIVGRRGLGDGRTASVGIFVGLGPGLGPGSVGLGLALAFVPERLAGAEGHQREHDRGCGDRPRQPRSRGPDRTRLGEHRGRAGDRHARIAERPRTGRGVGLGGDRR